MFTSFGSGTTSVELAGPVLAATTAVAPHVQISCARQPGQLTSSAATTEVEQEPEFRLCLNFCDAATLSDG